MHTTLSQLQQQIKSAIQQQLPLPQWVSCEISELKVNYSGHCYMELVEKSEDSTTLRAQVRAVIWRSAYATIAPMFESQSGMRLEAGIKILAKVAVSYHEVYGLSLQITQIDPSYTIGEVERERQLTIAQLKKDGVWEMNHSLPLPLVIQRLAVISSDTAAGYQDFCNHLRSYDYHIITTLYQATMQGNEAVESIIEALGEIANEQDKYDAIVIIRGGGSVTDLRCFDSYPLCFHVAQHPLPIISGIGHDKDVSVVDMVSRVTQKTPTAVAGWIVEQLASFEYKLDSALSELQQITSRWAREQLLRLERASNLLEEQSHRTIENQKSKLDQLSSQIELSTNHLLANERTRLSNLEQITTALSPQTTLRRGFAIVRHNSKVMTSTKEAQEGEKLELEFADGKLTTIITKE